MKDVVCNERRKRVEKNVRISKGHVTMTMRPGGEGPRVCREQRHYGNSTEAGIQSAGVPAWISTSLQETGHSLLLHKVTSSVLNI